MRPVGLIALVVLGAPFASSSWAQALDSLPTSVDISVPDDGPAIESCQLPEWRYPELSISGRGTTDGGSGPQMG